jgi:hypothetical protein
MTQLDRASLEIVSIETVAVRVPLAHRFSGSAYSMDNRCTVVTRLETANGLVSEVYNGDTDDEQQRIVDIIHDELFPLVAGLTAADPGGIEVGDVDRPAVSRSRRPASVVSLWPAHTSRIESRSFSQRAGSAWPARSRREGRSPGSRRRRLPVQGLRRRDRAGERQLLRAPGRRLHE